MLLSRLTGTQKGRLRWKFKFSATRLQGYKSHAWRLALDDRVANFWDVFLVAKDLKTAGGIMLKRVFVYAVVHRFVLMRPYASGIRTCLIAAIPDYSTGFSSDSPVASTEWCIQPADSSYHTHIS